MHLSAGSVGHEFVNCTFAACRGRQGGAIFAEEGVRLSILDSIFREGAAIEGGDVYGSEGSEVAISRSVFNSSYAILRGGSLFIAGCAHIPPAHPPAHSLTHPARTTQLARTPAALMTGDVLVHSQCERTCAAPLQLVGGWRYGSPGPRQRRAGPHIRSTGLRQARANPFSLPHSFPPYPRPPVLFPFPNPDPASRASPSPRPAHLSRTTPALILFSLSLSSFPQCLFRWWDHLHSP